MMPSFRRILPAFCFLYFQHGVTGELSGLLLGKGGFCLFRNCHSKISVDGQLYVVS